MSVARQHRRAAPARRFLGQLAGLLVLAVVVGVLGAIAPARRAARLDVLDAILRGE